MVGRYSTGQKARGPHAMIFERDEYRAFYRPCRGPVAVMVRSSPGRRRGRSAPRVGPQHNHAKSALRGAHVSWAVGRYSTGRTARGPLVTRFERGVHDLPKLVPPTCRGVGAVEPRPTAWGGVRLLLGDNTTMPSPQSGVWRVLYGRSVNIRRGKRAGRAPRDSNWVATTNLTAVLPSCRDGSAVEPRSTALGGARPASGTQPRRICIARRACSVNGRSLLHGAKSARAARHECLT